MKADSSKSPPAKCSVPIFSGKSLNKNFVPRARWPSGLWAQNCSRTSLTVHSELEAPCPKNEDFVPSVRWPKHQANQ